MADESEEQELGYTVRYDGESTTSQFLTRDGIATATFPNTDVFRGEYKNGTRNGQGTYTFASGAVYEGSYADSKRSGYGVFKSPDGSSYSGNWLNSKREGHGLYTYANGDLYSGEWRNGQKHGHGAYTYAAGSQVTGKWVEGKCVQGTVIQGGQVFTGTFVDGKPSTGMMAFPSSPHETHQIGGYEGTEWRGHHFDKPSPLTEPPAPSPADHHTTALRKMDRAVLKLDHFQAIYRLPKTIEGAPNFRKVDKYPIFGMGQPTLAGFDTIFHQLSEQGFSKFVWSCMRQEPVVYANDMSFAPREMGRLNENMEFENITAELLLELQDKLVRRYRVASKDDGSVHYYQDTFAENPVDRKNMLLSSPLTDENHFRTLDDVFTFLRDDKSIDVELHRLPIVDERAPSPGDFDRLLSVLRKIDDGTALLFNCQMGKGRTTTGMVCAYLMHVIKRGPQKVEEASAEEAEAEADDPDDDSEEAQGARKVRAEAKKKKEEEAATCAAAAALPRPEYRAIRELTAALPNGDIVKKEVDEAIDATHHMQNLRDCIHYTKEMYDKETAERRVFWKTMSVNFVERYFYLIAFHAYLRETHAQDFEPSFAQWVTDHKSMFDMLGSRDDGYLSTFNWD